jgi:hypothetical protein
VTSGAAAVTSGVWFEFGHGFALITGGVLAVAYGLLLIDVDERPTKPKEARR